VKLTEKEQKIVRLAFDKAAQPEERRAAAVKLMESLYARCVSVEDIERESVRIEYRERMQIKTVYPCSSGSRAGDDANEMPRKTVH
jgi:hypothetical protein